MSNGIHVDPGAVVGELSVVEDVEGRVGHERVFRIADEVQVRRLGEARDPAWRVA